MTMRSRPKGVLEPNQIALGNDDDGNPQIFRIRGAVVRVVQSNYPGKVVFGDTARESRPNTSSVAWTDWSGGIGIERIQGARDVDRLWQSNLNPTFPQHLVLGPVVDPIPNPAGIGSGVRVEQFAELGGILYAIFSDNGVRRYNGASWSDAPLHSITGRFNSMTTIVLEGVDYLVIAHSRGVDFSHDGITWTHQGI